MLLLSFLLKHIFGFHKIQIWFFILELKNKNEKYLKSRKISRNLENLKKLVNLEKKNASADGRRDCRQKYKIGVNWLSVKKD